MSTETIAGLVTLATLIGGGTWTFIRWAVGQWTAEQDKRRVHENTRHVEDRCDDDRRRSEDREDRKRERDEDRAALRENSQAMASVSRAMQDLAGKLTSFDVQLASLAESYESITGRSNIEDPPKLAKRARTHPHGVKTP